MLAEGGLAYGFVVVEELEMALPSLYLKDFLAVLFSRRYV
jgi:hypothetical protein